MEQFSSYGQGWDTNYTYRTSQLEQTIQVLDLV